MLWLYVWVTIPGLKGTLKRVLTIIYPTSFGNYSDLVMKTSNPSEKRTELRTWQWRHSQASPVNAMLEKHLQISLRKKQPILVGAETDKKLRSTGNSGLTEGGEGEKCACADVRKTTETRMERTQYSRCVLLRPHRALCPQHLQASALDPLPSQCSQ